MLSERSILIGSGCLYIRSSTSLFPLKRFGAVAQVLNLQKIRLADARVNQYLPNSPQMSVLMDVMVTINYVCVILVGNVAEFFKRIK